MWREDRFGLCRIPPRILLLKIETKYHKLEKITKLINIHLRIILIIWALTWSSFWTNWNLSLETDLTFLELMNFWTSYYLFLWGLLVAEHRNNFLLQARPAQRWTALGLCCCSAFCVGSFYTLSELMRLRLRHPLFHIHGVRLDAWTP